MRGVLVMVGLAAVALTGPATGQSKPSVVTGPDWLRRPNSDELRTAFPKKATAHKGTARITCIVTVQGLVRNCTITSEDPAGQGFGSAALSMTAQFLFRPGTVDGKPVEMEATIPIGFECYDSCGSVAQGGQPLISGLAWSLAPTQAQMVAAYPPKAYAAHILGVASIQCEITKDGGLRRCQTMSEEPRGKGFGSAAISLADHFHTPTNVPTGTKIDGSITRLTFTFGEQMYDGAPYVAKPKFTAVPTMAELLAAYPQAALKKNITNGSAIVKCQVVTDGQLTECKVLQETPAGEGIGQAVLGIAPRFHLSTWTDDGLPVIGTSVKLPIQFKIGDAPTGVVGDPATAP